MFNIRNCHNCKAMIYIGENGTVFNYESRTKHICVEPTMKKNLVTITRPTKTETDNTHMLVGQIALVTDKFLAFPDAVVLRTYDGWVNLHNPNQTWNLGSVFSVEILPDGTTVSITAGFADDVNVSKLTKLMLEHLKDGNIINAIKEVRTATGLGLTDAKKYTEDFRQRSWDDGTLPKTERTRYKL